MSNSYLTWSEAVKAMENGYFIREVATGCLYWSEVLRTPYGTDRYIFYLDENDIAQTTSFDPIWDDEVDKFEIYIPDKEKAMGKKTLRERLEDSKQFVVIVDEVRIRRVSDPNEYFTVRDDRTENCIVFDYTPSGKPVVDWCFEDDLPNDDIVELCGEDSDEVFSIDMNSTDWELHPDDKAKINKRLEETLAELMVS